MRTIEISAEDMETRIARVADLRPPPAQANPGTVDPFKRTGLTFTAGEDG